jgi:general secretion pathway protein H
MPISATGSNRWTAVLLRKQESWRRASLSRPGLLLSQEHRQDGFTLVELMVVLVILGLMSAAVVLAMPDPQGRVHHEAERFAARALAVRDDAIVQGRAMAIRIDGQGYAVERRTRGRWEGATDRTSRAVAWTQGTGVQAARGRVSFDPTGLIDEPLTVELSRSGATARIVFPGDGAVHVAR